MWGERMIFLFRYRLDYMTDDEFVNFVERNIVKSGFRMVMSCWKVSDGFLAKVSFKSKTVTVRYMTDDIQVAINDAGETVRQLQRPTNVYFCSISTEIRGGVLLFDKNGFLLNWIEYKSDSNEAIDFARKFYKKKRESILEWRDDIRRRMDVLEMPF